MIATLDEVADGYLATILRAVRQEYPNAPRHVTTGPDDRPTPRDAHPAFYGCFDWHSAVEMHWAAARLVRLREGVSRPGASPDGLRDEVEALFDEHLTEANLAVEHAYLQANPGFERPYGWGWLLQLAEELNGTRWAGLLRPLADQISADFVGWLARSPLPNRQGAHMNTSFPLTRAWPWAVRLSAAGSPSLATAIRDAAVAWHAADRDYPAGWEPSGNDFLSAALAEAELMVTVLPEQEARSWLAGFLPGLSLGEPASLFTPVTGADPTDGQSAHLIGLNLHRASVFRKLGRLLGLAVLDEAAEAHLTVALPHVVGGHWMTEHWLAAYAVLAIDKEA